MDVLPLECPKLGDLTSAQRATSIVEVGGNKISIVMDSIVVFRGSAISRLEFINPGGPFPAELQRTLVTKVVERAA